MIEETDIDLIAGYLLGTDNSLVWGIATVLEKEVTSNTVLDYNQINYLESMIVRCPSCEIWVQPTDILDDLNGIKCVSCVLLKNLKLLQPPWANGKVAALRLQSYPGSSPGGGTNSIKVFTCQLLKNMS